MKNLRLTICALLGVASAILSFSASAVSLPYWKYTPTGQTVYTSIGATCAAVQAYFTSVGNPSQIGVGGNALTCVVLPSGGVITSVSLFYKECADGQTLGPNAVCEDGAPPPPEPCEDNDGQEYSSTFYQGDASSSGGGGATYVPPTVVCLAECRSVLSSITECYSRAYVAGDPKFGQHAVFCTANYLGISAECETGDPSDAGNADAPEGTPTPEDNPPADDAPDCPPGTYAVKSGSQWICNSQDAPHPGPDEEGCPPGTNTGSMNGQTVCAPATGNGNPAPTGSGTPGAGGANGSGTGSGTGVGDGAGAEGSTGDTGGYVGSESAGGAGPDDGPGQTSVGVDCGSPPVCTGDPLLCGIQLQEYESACATQNVIGSPLPEEELDKWKAVGTPSDADEPSSAVSRVEQKLSSFSSRLSFQTSGCPSDFNISVLGRSIPIAISEACSLLQLMKMILFMGAYLFSLRVLWSSVL